MPAASRHVAGHDLRRALRALQLHGRTVGMRREGDAARVGAHRDALVLQHLGDGLGDVGILAPDQVRVLLHHRDLRPQAAKDLRKFQADVAAADHHQMLRQRAQLQDRGVVQRTDLIKPRQLRGACASAHVEEDARCTEFLRAHAQPIRRDKAGMATDQLHTRRLRQPLLHAGARRIADRVRTRHHLRQVDLHRAGNAHAIVPRAPGQVRHARACHQGLGRHAAGIDAGAAHQVPLDHRHPLATFGQAHRQRRPAWPAPTTMAS